MNDKVYKLILEGAENGATSKEIIAKLGGEGFWKAIGELTKEGKIFSFKKGGVQHYTSIEYKTEGDFGKENKMTKNEMGGELQNLLLDTIAKYSAGKVVEDVMPLIRKKCIEEFGMTPVTHEIKIGNQSAVTLKAELPPCFKSILSYAVNGNAVMLTGQAGTGKGYLARQVAKATGSEFYEVNAVKNSYDLTGFVDANSRFVRTPFYDACKAVSEGKKAVFLFDEMDCSDPEVLKIFNEALSSLEFTFPNDEHLTFEDLIILCACNTFGTGSDEMYCGQQLDASTLDRFAMVHVDYNRKVELSIARGDEELVDFIDAFRRQTEKNGLLFVASYRSLKRIVSMRGVLPLKQVMKECFLKSMADDDLQNILANMSDTENIYYKACKGEKVEWKKKQEEQTDLFQLTA